MDIDDPCGSLLSQNVLNVLNVWLYCTQGWGPCVTSLAAKEQSGFLLSFFQPEIAYLNRADLKSFAVFQFFLNCSHVTHNGTHGYIYSIKESQHVKKHLYSLLSLS